MDAIGFVLRGVRMSAGGKPRRTTVKVSGSPSRKDAAAPGWFFFKLAGKREQLAFGLHRPLGAIGGPAGAALRRR